MSEALRLAEWIAGEACGGSNWNKNAEATAAELRRLHAENERLREALRLIAAQDQGCGGRVTEAEAWRSAQSLALGALK